MSGTFLQPSEAGMSSTIDDLTLTAFLQQTLAGITGIPGNMVRPRWQPNPPIQPAPGVDWAAVGVLDRIPFDYPYEALTETAPYDMTGRYIQQRHERLEVMASFYGHNAGSNATRLRDGLYVSGNRDVLNTYGIKLREAGTATSAPEMVAAAFLNRVDLPISFVRQVDRTYAILAFLSAQISFTSDTDITFEVNVDLPAS